MEKTYQLLCYTREAQEDIIYSQKLAYSMHLALKQDDGTWLALNHNSGILYAKATSNTDGTLNAKSLKNPILFERADGGYAVIAERIEADGSADASAVGKFLLFTSKDLLHYTEQELIDKENACRMLQTAAGLGIVYKMPEGIETGKAQAEMPGEGLPEGAVCGNVLEIPEAVAKRLLIRFTTPVNVANEVPDEVRVHSIEELKQVKALARYSDGSTVEKKVDWYADKVDWSVPGEYEIDGKVHQEHYEFPIAWDRADPCIGKWNGKYYFIATNDADYNNTLYIREADTIPGLVTAQEVLLLDTKTYPHLKGLLWAPEFHIINDRLYIYHGGTPGPFVKEQCHVMALKPGGNPMKASDWEMPVRVIKADGSMLYGEEGITLDMTEFESAGKYYVCWSQRQFSPVDQGAWLYIAELNPDCPWQLKSEPVVLSKPDYGWANNHTFVDEGPYVVKRDGKIWMSFSSAAVDTTYVAGMLSAQEGADLLNPDNWVKENYPLVSSRSVMPRGWDNKYADIKKAGEFGPGHNSFVEDEDGLTWFVYHARRGVDGPRSSGLRRLHFNIEGFPVLDMTEELDLKPELTWVKTKIVIQ